MSDVSYNLVMYQLTQITSDSATLLATTQRHSLHKLAFIAVAPPGFCNRGGGSEVWVAGLAYEVSQKLTHLLQCIGNLYGLVQYDFNRLAVYLSFRTPRGGEASLLWRRHWFIVSS